MKKTIVAVVRCQDYEMDNVRAAVVRAIDLVGGIGDASDKRVLVKPNLLSARDPSAAVTTHPEVVEAVVELWQKAGATVLLGDSPPLAGEKQSSYERLLRVTGMADVAERMGAELVRFEDGSSVVENPQGRYFRKFDVAEAVTGADIVVNVPKLKTHGLTLLTGAVKNVFGCVPGRRKALFHAQAGEDRETFSQMLVDLLGAVRPQISIMDAVVAMDGDGPADGGPKHVGLILASRDPVALDAVASTVVGIDASHVHTTRLAAEQGLGVSELGDIEIVGEALEALVVRDFEQPKSRDMWTRIPKPIRRVLKNQLVPYPCVSRTCRSCNACVEECPVEALSKGADRPLVDLDKCIRCYCCREVCEFGAMDLRVGRLSSAIRAASSARRRVLNVFRKS